MNKIRILFGALISWMFLLCNPVCAKTFEIEYFASPDRFQWVKISPNGKHIAILNYVEGKNILSIVELKNFQRTYDARFEGRDQVGDFYWANDERLIIERRELQGFSGILGTYGEWFAVNYDGKYQKNIYGYRAGEKQTGSRIKKAKASRGWGSVVDVLKDDPKKILLSTISWDNSVDSAPALLELNIYNGVSREITRSPVPHAKFLVDHDGNVRLASGYNSQGSVEVHHRASKSEGWKLLFSGNEFEGYFRPLAFANSNQIYIADNRDNSLAGVYKFDLKSGERQLIYRNKSVDPSAYWFSADSRDLYAVEMEVDYPTYAFVSPESENAKILKEMLAVFTNQQVRIVSQSSDGIKSVLQVFSDRNPGDFHLYDRNTKSLRRLFKVRPWVDPKESAEVRPITFKSRDGIKIYGYLTLPPNKEAKDLPLVVLPHGGPHEVRDWWRYNEETQLLANRGIAVLQVNFRGSAGYGREFTVAGYRRWGSDIQYDIIDATHHVIKQGIANKDRVCIYGTSFGGYSALQSAILEPDLFACAVGFAGVYEMELLYKVSHTRRSRAAQANLERIVGKDDVDMIKYSPIHNVDKLKAPVLIIHGKEDEVAPIEHAKKLRDALKKKGHPYEWEVTKNEGHGFSRVSNRTRMYKTLLKFLETHLKI